MHHQLMNKLSKHIGFFFLLIITLSLSSCKDEKETYTPDYQYSYFPTDSGHYVIYDVDSVVYLNTNQSDTARYQLMILVGDTFYDSQNELAKRLWLFKRENASSPWTFDRLWWMQMKTTSLQVIEDDLRFVKFIFPPGKGNRWNGNAYLPTTSPFDVFSEWNYIYTDVGVPFNNGVLNFNECAIVESVNEENVIEKKLRTEVYGKNVGLVYQEYEILGKQPSSDWITGPNRGFRIRMKAIEHN